MFLLSLAITANMIDLKQASDLCVLRIVSPDKGTHPNYKRVKKLAELYQQLITGEDQDELLKTYFYKQSTDEIEKIKSITVPITSSVTNALISAFKKVLRVNPIVKKIDFQRDLDAKKPVIENAIYNYYSGSSLEFYIEKRFHDLTFTDPNAFIITEFEPLVDLTKKASPYPFEVSSEEAVNFTLKNGILQFLLVEHHILFEDEKGEPKAGIKLFNYLSDYAITFTEVKKTLTSGAKEGEYVYGDVTYEKRNESGTFKETTESLPVEFVTADRQFEIKYYTHKQGRVPAERVGYVPDKMTKGVTFVNPFHYGALPFLLKSIKSVAELDLTVHFHTFPQKIRYVDPCNTDANGICSTSGERIDGCKRCGGKGYLSHESAKDVIDFKLPRNADEMIDLGKLIQYIYPPIDGIKFQDEYIDKLTEKCYKGVFNSEVFSKDQVEKTATGTNLDIQNAYDPMSDYANKVADYWKKTVLLIAAVLDYNDAIVEFKYPKDFKLKSVTDLLADLANANQSEAPAFIISELNRDIANQLYLDRPQEMVKYEVKQRLAPFAGKTATEISLLLTQEFVSKLDKVLYNYFELFLEQLEEDSLKATTGFEELLKGNAPLLAQLKVAKDAKLIWFYDLPFDIQKALLKAKAQQKLAEIEAETPSAVSFTEGGGA